MATFNTYDYDFLVKCLSDGSTIFKSEALKRLNTLAGADKKQFINHLKQVMTEMEDLYRQDKEEINYQAIMLLSQIVSNIHSKELPSLLMTRHLPLIVPALGHPSKTNLRKAAHTLLLTTLRTFPEFATVTEVYVIKGLQSENQLVQQKSINSFQSIFILEAKHFQWTDPRSKALLQALITKIDHQNSFVAKAASQCILSLCKSQGIKKLVPIVERDDLQKLKDFLNEAIVKIPVETLQITPNEIAKLLGPIRPKQQKVAVAEAASQSGSESESQRKDLRPNQRRLQKIKRAIRNEEKRGNGQSFGGGGSKLFAFVSAEGSLKQRTQAMEDLLYKIQVSKKKPQFESSMRAVFPTILKMLRDTNPKIVGLTLRILQNIIEWVSANEGYLANLVTVIVQKLGDQKISIRQNVSKVIRELAGKTKKGIWVRELMQNLRKNTSTVLKDETLYLVHYIYQNCPPEQQVDYPTADIINQIAQYTDDPKTKIKIRTLDCLSIISYRSKEPERYTQALKQKMSSVFHQMYRQKLAKLQEESNKKVQQEKRRRRETIDKTSRQTSRTNYREERGDTRSEGQEQGTMNLSMETIKKRVSLLRKPRNLLSTQETISDGDSTHRQSKADKTIEDIEIVLPSLYKKTSNNRFGRLTRGRKTDFSPNKTIQGKSDYLSKEDLQPLRQPEKQMRNILSELRNNDWKTQFEAANKLRRLIQFHPEILQNATAANIHTLALDMMALVENLRSSVAKNSLICLNEFVQLMGRQIDPQMDLILEKLIRRSADTNVFISSEVQKCLSTLANSASPTKLLEKLAAFRDNKSSLIKEAIVDTLISMSVNARIREKQYGKLAESLAFYMQDGQLQVRSKAKDGIVSLNRYLGDWYRALRGKINPIHFKSICELMTKGPPMPRREQLSATLLSTSTVSPQPQRGRGYRDTSRLTVRAQQMTQINQSQMVRSIQKAELPPTKRKGEKVAQFPSQFSEIQGILENANSSEWKKRMESLTQVKALALKYPNEFMQYRSSTHFVDVMCKQVNEPNLKVSLNSLTAFLQLFESLQGLFENNLGVICNSIFAALSSNKLQVKQKAEACTDTLLKSLDVTLFIQYLCQGILYALPKSRVYLVNQLSDLLETIYEQKKQLMYKNIYPLLNKLLDEYKTDLMPHVVNLLDRMYGLIGNAMFSHLTKFKEVRELLGK